MKKLSALAALSLAGLAVSAAPAQAESTSFGQEGGMTMPKWNVTTADLCHRDLAGYPLVGPAVDHATGACDALGAAVDHPEI